MAKGSTSMNIFRNIDSIPEGISTVVSIGKFDGVHLGHQEIIKSVCNRARALGCHSAVVTFDPHPSLIVGRSSHLMVLTSLRTKLRLLARLGLDAVVVLPFTRELAETTPEDFVRRILVEKLAVKEIHEGTNFRFGKSASADCEYLREAGSRYGFGVQIHDPVRLGKHTVSSSVIRSLLANRKYELANMMLARPCVGVEQHRTA